MSWDRHSCESMRNETKVHIATHSAFFLFFLFIAMYHLYHFGAI